MFVFEKIIFLLIKSNPMLLVGFGASSADWQQPSHKRWGFDVVEDVASLWKKI